MFVSDTRFVWKSSGDVLERNQTAGPGKRSHQEVSAGRRRGHSDRSVVFGNYSLMVRWVVGSILHCGARCSSMVRAFTNGAMGRRINPSLWSEM